MYRDLESWKKKVEKKWNGMEWFAGLESWMVWNSLEWNEMKWVGWFAQTWGYKFSHTYEEKITI